MTDTLLIVDNEESILRCLTLMFKGQFNILTASSGTEALELLKHNQVSCIVSDHDMENGDGLFLIKNITKKEIPFILVTGRGEKSLFKNFANERAFHIYEKPINTSIVNVVKDAISNFHHIQKQYKESLIGKGTGNILHDLNNGLAIVQMSASIGVANPLKDTGKHFNRILEGCKKINSMIAKYKDFMNGNENIKLTHIDLESFMSSLVQECIAAFGGKALFEMKNALAPKTNIIADDVLLRQIILNLVSNSLHEIRNQDSPSVNFSLYNDGHHIVVDIQDSGSISEEVSSHLFEEGFSTKQENGTGMGLVYCKTFLKKMNADIWLSNSNPTTFSIKFKA